MTFNDKQKPSLTWIGKYVHSVLELRMLIKNAGIVFCPAYLSPRRWKAH